MYPLLEFCANPYQAADKNYLHHIPLVESGDSVWWKYPQKALQILRRQGSRKLIEQLKEYWWWKKQK